jgi:organic radical activating enzyme
MTNKFPVKVETYENAPPHKFVEWKLHDKCNYDCSFCGDENKLGIRGWFDLEKNKAIVDRIAVMCGDTPYWIQLTGGEPTLYPKLIELMTYMKQKGAYVSMISNGSRTLRWWKMLKEAKVLDFLYVTYHSQQRADYKHIVEVLNLFHDAPVLTVAVATYTKDSIALSLEGVDYIAEHTGSWITMNAMDLLDYYIDTDTVTEEQFDRIKGFNGAPSKMSSTKMKVDIPIHLLGLANISTVTYSDGSIETKNPILMMKSNENRFEGWNCEAGLHSIKIEDDFIYRGGCKRDPVPLSLNNIKFYDKSFKCDVLDCFCYTDMVSTKTKTDV